MMSRVLWLLSLDDEKSTLGRTLETYGRTLPEWVWIPWIPQLLTSLTRRYRQTRRPKKHSPAPRAYSSSAFLSLSFFVCRCPQLVTLSLLLYWYVQWSGVQIVVRPYKI